MSEGFADAVVVVAGNGLGQGDEALTQKVIITWFRTLLELGHKPKAVLFYTAGVKLVAEGSPAVEVLKEVAAAGIPLIVCRTCLEYYGLMDRVAVGEIGNMAMVVEAQAAAAKVVSL